MKFYMMIFISIMLTSCGFNSSEDETTGGEQVTSTSELSKKDDSDGDLISNEDELNMGRNPLLADIPELRVRFLQNYKIIGKAKNLATGEMEEFSIDTRVGRDNPDFKYRVGRVFIRDESYKQGAKVGRYSGHSYGETQEHDLSWVKYPDVDPTFYLKQVMDHKKYFDKEKYEIESISAYLESTAKLKENGFYKSVKNFSVNFYYYDYEKENYEILSTQLIEKHFNQGVNEIFEVEIPNLPVNLIEDNYFKKGEFIISEVNDYEIPELKTTYKTLLKSVKEKSVPVVFNTPLEGSVRYVGLNGGKFKLNKILEILFDKNFEIANDKIKKIQQFENNLPDFTYLREVAEYNKKGRWFIFTSPINKHFLDYDFGKDDFISISYILGNELAGQTNEVIYSYRESADTGNQGTIYSLGNITPNSEVHFQLKPNRVWGEKIKHWKDTIFSPGGSCGRNCIRREYYCNFKFNIFESLDQKMTFNQNFSGELERIKLLVNQDEFELKNLVAEKKVVVFWNEGNLHIKINDISSIKEIVDVEENVISLKLIPFTQSTYNGVLLESWSGRDWYFCPGVAINVAGHNKWPLSVESKEFGKWQHQANWSRVIRGDRKTYSQYFSVGMSGIVNNQFN